MIANRGRCGSFPGGLSGICARSDGAVRITVWAREWLDEFWREDEKGKMALLLGKGVEGICNREMEDVGECVLYWLGRWWQRRK